MQSDRYNPRPPGATTLWTNPWLVVHIALTLLIAGCGGDDDDTSGPAAPIVPESAAQIVGAVVTLSGQVTFDLVPAVPGIGLDYGNTRAAPARGVTVELVSGTTVLASTVTDPDGAYSFSVAPNTNVAVRVRASMVRSGHPSWDFRIVDNTNGDALYVLDGASASSGSADSTRNLHAPSGWSGASYTAPRSAAPFAILDAVHDAVHFVLAANPAIDFPRLEIHWSPNNVPNFGTNGSPDIATGEIGTSFYSPAQGIFLLGAENADTEEYDRHVIVHEWGHFFEHTFSRSDSIGGPHTRGDQLDMRVAFGEGWGNALSAMVTGDPIYRDVSGQRQANGFGFDVEGPFRPGSFNQRPGWYSEETVQEILYDLYDDSVIDLMPDGIALGFRPLYEILTTEQRTSVALTSIFPFITGLKAAQPASAPQIDTLLSSQSIDPVADGYGGGETHFGNPESPDLQSVYVPLTVGGGPVNVCSLDTFRSGLTGMTNKLGSRRFVKFAVAAPGAHTISARTTEIVDGAAADPDMVLHRRGPIRRLDGSPSVECTAAAPTACTESGSVELTAGEYVLEVYEWTNTNADDDADYPPVGRTCFDIEVVRR